jgi:hypothetical protein
MKQTELMQGVDAFIASIKKRSEDATKASDDGRKAVDILRNLAKATAADGLNSEQVAEFMANRMKLADIPLGTIKPYRIAFRGYVEAVKADINVDAFKTDAKGKARPMTAPEAREFLTRANETDTERAVREESERLAELRKAIMQRVNAVKDEPTLTALLDSDILPALPEGADAEERAERGAETRKERERREAEEASRKALEAAFATSEGEETAPAAVTAAG